MDFNTHASRYDVRRTVHPVARLNQCACFGYRCRSEIPSPGFHRLLSAIPGSVALRLRDKFACRTITRSLAFSFSTQARGLETDLEPGAGRRSETLERLS
jgi:hypothetical protein